MKAAKILLIVLTVGSLFWGVGVAIVAAQTAVPQGSTGYSTVPPYYSNEYVRPLDTSSTGWMQMPGDTTQATAPPASQGYDTVPPYYPSEYVRPLDTSKSGWMNMSGSNNSQALDTSKSGWMTMSGHKPGM